MANPFTVNELMTAVKTRLEAVTWTAPTNHETAFAEVVVPPVMDGGVVLDLVNALPAAGAVYRGAQRQEDNPEWQVSTVGVIIVCSYPVDRSGTLALLETGKLFDMLDAVLTDMVYLSETLGEEVWWSATSEGAILTRPGEPAGQSYVAIELTFQTEHQSITAIT